MEGPSGYAVRKNGLSAAEVSRIRSELRVRADWDPKKSYGPPPTSFKVYSEDPATFYVPVFWGREVFGQAERVTHVEEPCPGLAFQGALKQELHQPEAVEATMRTLLAGGGGILAVFTGGGKTCMALYIACQLKVKTLIIVNRTVLMQQWQDRIATFVPGARVGTVQGPIQDTQDKDIVVAMLQSLSQRAYDLRGFGFSVVDECNHIAAPTFSQAMLHTNCRYKLGLSATPERKDGLTRVLTWFLGPIFCTMKRQDEGRVMVEVVAFDCPDFRLPPPSRLGKLDFNGVLHALCYNDARNERIVDRLAQLPAERHTLVLSARRPHCETLASMLQARGVDARLYLGGMRPAALEEASRSRVLVATYSMAAEGLDIPSLNTLLLATPKGDVVQACGRVLRGEGGAVDPLIIDVRDCWGCVASQFWTRRGYYLQSGYSGLTSSSTPACGFCS